jgi:hypothetical protein
VGERVRETKIKVEESVESDGDAQGLEKKRERWHKTRQQWSAAYDGPVNLSTAQALKLHFKLVKVLSTQFC